MLIIIVFLGVIDIIIFIISFGLCCGQCKDQNRTWFSYSCVRSATKCAGEMSKNMCNSLKAFSCCFCCFLTLPIGFALFIIGMAFDLIAWLATAFYCFGFCCEN